MKREPANFQETFDAFTRAVNFVPSTLATKPELQQSLLDTFNRSYKRAYEAYSWEDAWDGAEVTPVAREIDFASLSDARRFEIWTADPRDPRNRAVPLRFTTTQQGALLLLDVSTAYVLSLPSVPKFTLTAYVGATAYTVGKQVLATDGNVYRCLQNGTGQEPSASPATWKLLPVLAILADFTVLFGRGSYLLVNGQQETGRTLRDDELLGLERLVQTEHFRLAANAWQPTC